MNALDVLVADDDEDTRTALVRAATDLDFRCRAARDGQEALEHHERDPAAIVLAEWRMPRLDGVGLCRALKAHRSPPYVLLMTLGDEPAWLAHALRDGVDAFLRKPIELDELEARLLAASRIVRADRGLTDARASLVSDSFASWGGPPAR